MMPALGRGLNWEAVRKSIERVEYEATSRRLAVSFQDGTRLEYTLPVDYPGRRADRALGEGGRIPRVSRLLALAIKFEKLIGEGKVRNYRDVAEAGQISRARMSQIMCLSGLAPEIQEELLFLPKTVSGPDRFTEKSLRQIARSIDWDWQRKRFRILSEQTP